MLSAPLAAVNGADEPKPAPKPNVIVILTDDLGYDDVGCYWTPDKRPGFERIETPNIDRLAAEGARFTDYYAPSSVCTPSRAALMTGCYPVRVGMSSFGRNGHLVLYEAHVEGLNPAEVTLAEILKKRGYATACVGKWHLGHLSPFSPRQHGFDAFYGMMFPNDMKPFVLHRDETVTPYERKQGAAMDALLPEALYDLAADVGETKDLIRQHPEVAQRLRALAERMREDIGDSATNQKGKNRRPVGRVPASGQ